MQIKAIFPFPDTATAQSFGYTPDNMAAWHYTLSNKNGVQLGITNYGATVTSLKIPTPTGRVCDIVLGFDHVKGYADSFSLPSAPYFGTIVGRYAGRIANGHFELNSKEFQLEQNNGDHALHGGSTGLSTKIWDITNLREGANPAITLRCVSLEGEGNYPGTLTVEVTYTLTEENEFKMDYRATTSADTIINLTHHSYFNLNGHDADVRGLQMSVNADNILETNQMIPTGHLLKLTETPFDFSEPKNCPDQIDTTFVLNHSNQPAATLSSKRTGIGMLVYTDQPAVHVYVGGNCYGQIKGKENAVYHSLSGICFETQHFPDAPNHAHFPSTLLKKEDIYHQHTTYKLLF